MSKPFRLAGLTKRTLFTEMASSPDPKIRAMVSKLRGVKGWTVDDLFELLCEMKGVEPEDALK